MAEVSSTIDTQIRYPGIKVRTESGKPAKLDQADTPTFVSTESGTGVGLVENLGEYTEGNRTGTILDVVLKNAEVGVSNMTLRGDADNDAGETKEISLPFTLTTTDAEAGSFELPAPVTEPIA